MQPGPLPTTQHSPSPARSGTPGRCSEWPQTVQNGIESTRSATRSSPHQTALFHFCCTSSNCGNVLCQVMNSKTLPRVASDGKERDRVYAQRNQDAVHFYAQCCRPPPRDFRGSSGCHQSDRTSNPLAWVTSDGKEQDCFYPPHSVVPGLLHDQQLPERAVPGHQLQTATPGDQ